MPTKQIKANELHLKKINYLTLNFRIQVMHTALWQNVVDFNFDQPLSEYGFSTRLENEQCWTVNFSAAAILEYKKFMYLAAISDVMVSPSSIVDCVWHQHLLFSKSYEEFCSILGKRIQHIPSTHQQVDFEKFRLAKEKTTILYREHFGEQPTEFWDYPDMLSALRIKKSTIDPTIVFSIATFTLIFLLFLGYQPLKSIYIQIDNPYFLICYIPLSIISFLSLEHYNRSKLRNMVNKWDKSSFVFNLSAMELIYLRRRQINDVIHGVVNQLITDRKIHLSTDQTLRIEDRTDLDQPAKLCVIQTLNLEGKIKYNDLLIKLQQKPVFHKTVKTMGGLMRHWQKSTTFSQLLIVNLTVIYTVLLLGMERIATGYFRDRPILIIGMMVIVLTVYTIYSVKRLQFILGSVIIPEFYDEHSIKENNGSSNWEWSYFFLGTAVFVGSFESLINKSNRTNNSGDSGSSCSSGEGCGSGCGGCGGD